MSEADGQQVQQFRQWIHEQKTHLNSIETEEFLGRFLRVSNNDLDEAKKRLIEFWKYRTENPQWFTNRDLLKNSTMLDIARTAYCIQLPRTTKENRLIFILRVGHFDLKKYTLDDVTKYAFAVADILNSQPAAQIDGFIILLDFSEVKLQHVTEFAPESTRKYVNCWEKMYPVRFDQIHFYNYPVLVDPILRLFRMFCRPELNDRIYLHSTTSEDSIIKSLHRHIDPSLLPQEFGGQLGSIEGEMNDKFTQWMKEQNDSMIQLDQYGIDLKQVDDLFKTIQKKND